jgi:hypothetical protein
VNPNPDVALCRNCCAVGRDRIQIKNHRRNLLVVES